MPNTIIKASAGSGKTFQLSNEFLRIVLRTEESDIGERINSILASTFTRKAAGEILDRILNRLSEAALEPEKQDDFARWVGLSQNDPQKRTDFLQNATAEIAKNLYRLRICTLNAFFNKIASSFAMELSMPPGWSIIDETEYHRLIHEAVQEVCAESHKNEVRKLLHLLQKGEQKLNVTQEIVKLAKDFLPLIRSTDAETWDHSATDKLGDLAHCKMTEEALRHYLEPFCANPDFGKNLLPQVADREKKGQMKPHSRFASALDKLLNAVQSQHWEEVLYNGLGNRIALSKPGNSEKPILYDSKPIEPPLYDLLAPLVYHARAIWAETLIHQTQATRSLLDLVWNKLESRLKQAGGFQFEDITFGLGEMFERNPHVLPQPLLAHRMDAPTKHLLLDEFQDTSLSQWQILKPFVQSVITSEDSSFFCVGDLKQAIYGWRGGIAEIFGTVHDYLEHEGGEELETPVLNETWRNSEAVIAAVNQVFLSIADNVIVKQLSSTSAGKWQNWFGQEPHQTRSPSKEQGFCVLESVPTEEVQPTSDSEDETPQIDTEHPFWKYTLDRIERLHQQHPSRSIGILFRNKNDISSVLKGLKTRNIEASDEGGVPLTDSAAVQHVLSVMTLIDHPGDTIARFHLANGPLKNLLHLHDDTNKSEAEKTAHCWRTKLLSQGYGKTVKELMSALTPCEPKEMQRLEKLLELAYQFDEKAVGTRTRQFMETVRATRIATPSAAMVRVMTIHGAKGLEFDIVVLPDLEKEIVPRRPPKIVIAKPSPTSPVDCVLRWVDQDLRPLLPEPYPQAFIQWKDEQVKEALAVLYVAMTRARHELVMLVREKSRTQNTYAGVLRAGLKSEQPTQKAPVLFQIGNEHWDHEEFTEASEPSPLVWHPLAEGTRLRNLPRVTPSGRELRFVAQHSEVRTPVNTAVLSKDTAALRGTALHACFALVEWLDEKTLDDAMLIKIVNQALLGQRSKIDPKEIVHDFRSMCEQSNIQEILRHSSYSEPEQVHVETERRFAVHWQGKILRGTMDRIVTRRQGHQVTEVEIIDFKTDQKPKGASEADFISERTKMYRPQMLAYKEAAVRMYPQSQALTAKLLFVSLNEIVPV